MKDKLTVINADCRTAMPEMAARAVLFDSCVTDPPYHLASIVKRFGGDNAAPAQEGTDGAFKRASRGFMGKTWDGGDIAFDPATWRMVYDLLKPGAHLVAFSHTRLYHRMAVAIEDAGFEIRDQLAWIYGTGFPKSHDVAKGIDRHLGVEREVVGRGTKGQRKKSTWDDGGTSGVFRAGADGYDITAAASPEAKEWQGWGSALKPAWEPIVLARKPLDGSIAANVLAHRTGGLNIDAARVPVDEPRNYGVSGDEGKPHVTCYGERNRVAYDMSELGRFPSNILHDGSREVLDHFPPGAAKFFYSAKAPKDERIDRDDAHPTVKPVDVMEWLCKLVTPSGGHILEPFAGTGTTGIAAALNGFKCTLIEREEDYYKDILARMEHSHGDDLPMFSTAQEKLL